MRKSQRDMMRDLVRQLGRDANRVIRAYTQAEQRGEVKGNRNTSGSTRNSMIGPARRTVSRRAGCEMAETKSKTGVILAGTFRDNLIVDRYDVGFLTMRSAKSESMRSES